MSETVPLDLSVDRVRVFLDGEIVGSLTLSPAKTVAFSYESSWLSSGFSISPLSLPLREGVFVAKRDPLHGLFGRSMTVCRTGGGVCSRIVFGVREE